jgi:hypothetical protein
METMTKLIPAVPETPVLKKAFRLSEGSIMVEYSIDVDNDDVWSEETTVHIYKINGESISSPRVKMTRAQREELDMLIREHAANVLNEFELGNPGCGHDQWKEQNGF